MIFLKIEFQKISTVYNVNKTSVLAFYNSFLKIEINCDKENMVTLNTGSFQKKMLSNICSGLFIEKVCS